MAILITGVTGFLGENFIKTMAQKKEVLALVRNADKVKSKNIKYIEQDLADRLDYKKLPSKIDAVVHLAQSNNYHRFPDGADDTFAINCYMTQQLAQYALKAKAKNFIFASTGSVYEPFALTPFDESAPITATSLYPVSKAAGELILKPYQDSFNIFIPRLYFLYDDKTGKHLISSIIQKVINRQPIIIQGDKGGLKFNPTHIQDISVLLEKAITQNWTGTLNLASPEQTTILDLAQEVSRITGIKLAIERKTQEIKAIDFTPNLSRLKKLYPSMCFKNYRNAIKEITSQLTTLSAS